MQVVYWRHGLIHPKIPTIKPLPVEVLLHRRWDVVMAPLNVRGQRWGQVVLLTSLLIISQSPLHYNLTLS